MRVAILVLAAALVGCGGSKHASNDANLCGNGTVDPGEDCDDGPANGTAGDSCGATCKFACSDPAADCPAPSACQVQTCSATHACMAAPDTTQNGMSCGSGLVCANGECISATCGNGIVEANEECDFGSNNGANTGCESDCKFSCTTTPTDSCNDMNACNGVEACMPVTFGSQTGYKCSTGVSEANGTSCGGSNICVGGMCVAPSCGDGFVEGTEQCDDGALNGTVGDGCTMGCTFVCQNAATDCGAAPSCQMWTCSAQHTCVATADTALNNMACGMVAGYVCRNGSCVSSSSTCGNGTRESGEQCDDGNTTNLDGCDANCKFEQVHRINSMSIAVPPNATDTFCPKNAMGGAIVGTYAQGQINNAITNGIGDGSITIIFDMLNLDDLSGTNDSSMYVGVIGGSPQAGSTTYMGANDLDWWYTTDATTIDATRTAKTQMPATIASSVLNAGPKEIVVTVNFVGVIVTMDMFASRLKAMVGASSTPTVSTSGMSPGHTAAEHLDPTLTSFATTSAGELCGNTTAQSLANVQVPSVLVGSACNQNYSTANTLLDVYISGCTALFIAEVKATQPDVSRDGATYHFTANASHVVTSCTRNGVADTLSDCLTNAGYTSLFKLTSDRVIAK